MKSHDIRFIVNSGKNRGKSYGFTLALNSAQKAWRVRPLALAPPEMEKEVIELVITARDSNYSRTGSRELVRVNQIKAQLDIIAKEIEPVTLKGLDNTTRKVRLDRDGYEVSSVINELGKDPEYLITVTCWSIYE